MSQLSADDLHRQDADHLPGQLGIKVTDVGQGVLTAELEIKPELLAINGFLHAGTVVTLADSAAGYGCMANLPETATGFTTIELKCNLMGTARAGRIECTATCLHAGRTTQVWESTISDATTGKLIAKFSCTQMLLYPR